MTDVAQEHEAYRAAMSKIDAELKELTQQRPSMTNAIPDSSWWSVTNAMTISAAVLLFGLLIFGVSAWLIRKGNSPESILRIFGTLLIIIAALFLVVAGYEDRQISPVMGLLGTIAGYLLGKGETKSDNGGKSNDNN